VALCQ
jgi:hypothetical protein